VIIFHGITLNKGRMLDEGHEFRSMGYNIMLVDFRGHGNSEGNTTTIGMREPEEVKLAYDYMVKRGEKKIFLYGLSMGAVVVTKAISDYQLNPSGIIIEMPFLSLQAYLRAQARSHGFSGQQRAFAFLTTFWVGVERGFNGYKHQTTRYAKNVHCPVLMQYAGKDAFVLRDEAEKIFGAIASADKRLALYDRAQHESLVRFDPLRWRIEVGKFLNDH
jgi:alpha-beta hydrolase superfamily lysophospholipase